MANIVGISLFAVTADQQVVFVKQSSRNSVAPNGFAASSSGSLDWKDVLTVIKDAKKRDTQSTLHEVLMQGMLRELAEEANVDSHEIVPDSERITGYFRWLSRGAKPEFCSLVQLTVTAHQLRQRQIIGTEQLYTDTVLTVPLHLLFRRPGEDPSTPAERWALPQPRLERELA